MTTPRSTPDRQQLRLPGSVAEVDASPEGPEIGAFFDLDGTLVAGFTVAAITRDRLRRREVGAAEFLHMMQLALEYRLGRRQFENVIEGAVRSAKGRLAEDVDEVGERIFRQSIADLIYPEMRELVRAHQRRGHTVVLSSSALTMQAVPVARYLGIEHVVCNRFVVDELGILTGEIERPVIWGTTKATSVQRFAAEHHVDLRSSYFYADGDEDLALMHLVGHPRPVNPGPALTKVAERRGWPILRFSSRGSGSPLARVRGLAAIGSLGPFAAGALGVGLLTRNKRTGVNFLTRYWPETVLTLNGVKLNVTGAGNLTAQRPAVFLFNHRNNFDVFMVAALVKDNWTGIAKKELESNPLVGPLGKLLDAAFIDRADAASAVAALKPIEEAARKGLSILVSPEGTRLDTQTVGPFKKGAFRIAMATGLPVVPIVIRNSDSVAGRNATTLNPGTVDIAVLPPVSVEDWTVRNLNERIEQIRACYVELLADWPAAVRRARAGAGRRAAAEPDGRAGAGPGQAGAGPGQAEAGPGRAGSSS
jgi:putative phosphoserine phosphatase/1-acylglycerol-3-phosphate O-acyltransferase